MIKSIENNLYELSQILSPVSVQLYTRESKYLFGSSIGQHVRHILEMYEVLLEGYSSGRFSFENRKRNHTLEENVREMLCTVEKIAAEINKKDKELICVLYDQTNIQQELKTTYFRELLYCFEHGIHHQALIKVALKEFEWENIPENFGVAPSTIKFRLTCAQ
ncbi:DinB family protein [Chryseobacterium cheonjiense]|uniref:DinB family protein n=1 Tax=Chryseobacterium cheonjiense TaxID=2728845 RepID=A0A7Y0A9U3_9FLAO|nr:DinB family protein [Chryseobacterium cheonjiense]NML59331.1 DinB family protein [Chryseobacterium cheonjiense]